VAIIHRFKVTHFHGEREGAWRAFVDDGEKVLEVDRKET
jgi:hypothetical protein